MCNSCEKDLRFSEKTGKLVEHSVRGCKNEIGSGIEVVITGLTRNRVGRFPG